MPELGLIVTDGTGHLTPIHATALHSLTQNLRIVEQSNDSLQHRGIYRIFVDMFRGQSLSVIKAEPGVKGTSFGIHHIVLRKPIAQDIHLHFAVFFLYSFSKAYRQCSNLDKNIVAKPTAITHNIDLPACFQLLVIGHRHYRSKYFSRQCGRIPAVQHTAMTVIGLPIDNNRAVVISQIVSRYAQYFTEILHN